MPASGCPPADVETTTRYAKNIENYAGTIKVPFGIANLLGLFLIDPQKQAEKIAAQQPA